MTKTYVGDLSEIHNRENFTLYGVDGVTYQFRKVRFGGPHVWEAVIAESVAVLQILYHRGGFHAHYRPQGVGTMDSRVMDVYVVNDVENEVFENTEVLDLDDDLEFDAETERNFLQRAVDACERWRQNEANGVQNYEVNAKPLGFGGVPRPMMI